MDEAELVQRAAAGDKDAFAAIYDRYAGRLYDFLWWVLQDRQEAEDALHDTFLVAGSRLPELDDPARLRSWLFAIAGGQGLDAARKRGHTESSTADWDADTGTAAEPTKGELVDLARAAADELSPTDRAVLDLHLRQGLQGQELADALGVSPEYARLLVTQLIDRIERSLGADLVARFGRNQCPELAALLADWDETRDAGIRERVAQHADSCPTCGARRRQRVGTAALLTVAPTFTPPDDVRGRVLGDVDLEEHDDPSWSGRRGGSPRPLIANADQRWLVAGVGAFLILVALAAFLVTRGGGTAQKVASVGSTTTPSTTRPSSTTSTSRVPTTTSTVPGPGAGGDAAAAAGGAGTGAGSTLGAGTGSGGGSRTSGTDGGTGGGTGGGSDTSGDTGGGGSTGGGGGGGGSDTTTTTAPPVEVTTTTTTTTVAPDTTGPSLSGLSVSPSVVRARSGCSEPGTATVTVHASDPSGIASISVTAGPSADRYSMSSSGGDTYTATVGPFQSLISNAVPVPVIVQAADGAGNTNALSAPSGTLSIRCTS